MNRRTSPRLTRSLDTKRAKGKISKKKAAVRLEARTIAVDSINPVTRDEAIAMWAALAAMVVDSHAPQETLTATQWEAADALFDRVDTWMNRQTKGTTR